MGYQDNQFLYFKLVLNSTNFKIIDIEKMLIGIGLSWRMIFILIIEESLMTSSSLSEKIRKSSNSMHQYKMNMQDD